MENCFLRGVARAYVQNNATESVFVLPNRRSLKFFRMFLGQEYGAVAGKPLFAPKIVTINEFFTSLSGLVPGDSVELLYLLYREYVALSGTKETFDEFVHWGESILADFNDVDKYLVDARQLFSNIKELKQLENDYSFLTPRQFEAVKSFWTNYLNGGNFSGKKEFFGSVWEIMYPLYINFKAALSAKGIGYEGQIYRSVAEKVDKLEFDKRVVFIGFNAPNRCEKRVMQYLRDAGKGDFYWDFYGTMLTDPQNGASEIIGACVKEFPSMYRTDSGEIPAVQQVKVYASPSGTGQASVLARILDELYEGDTVNPADAFSTAVVLPDENLLMPVLNAIPPKFKSINVTMGYPLQATPLASFMGHLNQLQSDVRMRNGELCFYHKSLLELLSHEYVKRISGIQGLSIKEKVVAGNMIYIRPGAECLKVGDEFLEMILQVVSSVEEINAYQMAILKFLDSKLESWDREFIYQYYMQLHRLSALDVQMEPKTYFRLAEKLCRGIVVPFKGEPLAGLQVMGTLETRALDFDNVIILSANEGKFPSSNTGNSLIPYNLRIGFGLPTYELQDGIAAYHFYRGICRSRNLYMIYDTRSDGLGTGEVSRYVKQLKYHFGADVQECTVVMGTSGADVSDKVEIVKDDKVMDILLSNYTNGGSKALSASAINSYISCPLKFYVENVLGLGREEEVADSIEENVFGSIFHYVMERLYKEYEGKLVGEQQIKELASDTGRISRLILEGFGEYVHISELEGQHKIVEALIMKYVKLALGVDILKSPFKYIAGERRFLYKLPVNGGELLVNFKAFVDRIDRVVENDTLRIIDYKTGSVTVPSKGFELGELFDKEGDGSYKAILQLYLYALICKDGNAKEIGNPRNTELVIYPLKKIARDGIVSVELEMEKLEEFKRLLSDCIGEIFNREIPFRANPDEKKCSYCACSAICGK